VGTSPGKLVLDQRKAPVFNSIPWCHGQEYEFNRDYEPLTRVFSFTQPDCRNVFHSSEIAQRTVVGNRGWNRIEAELEAGLPGKREPGRRQPVNQDRKGPKVSKTDAESILKHIEEALQEDDARV
jgi:hypothetical protein